MNSTSSPSANASTRSRTTAFHEIGTLAGVASYDDDGDLTEFTPSNFVFGTADIDGRPVILSGDDFTVRGGSADASIAGKRAQREGLALETRLPHIRLVDGMGGGGSVKTIEMAGRTYIPELRGWETVVRHLGLRPRCRWPWARSPASAPRASPPATTRDRQDSAQMMIAGPALVDWAELGDVSKEELGARRSTLATAPSTTRSHPKRKPSSGATRFLSYLPSSVDELPPVAPATTIPIAATSAASTSCRRIPQGLPDAAVIDAVVDEGSVFEIGASGGVDHLRSRPAGRIAGGAFRRKPMVYGGAWTADSCRKLIRLIDLASTFHLPLVISRTARDS